MADNDNDSRISVCCSVEGRRSADAFVRKVAAHALPLNGPNVPRRRLLLVALLSVLSAAEPAAAADPRDPVLRLQAGLPAAANDAALATLAESCFDLRRTARDILTGLPEADAEAERRLAAALLRRLVFQLRRRPPAPPGLTWIEDRPLGPGEWLLLTSLPADGSEARILAWRVLEGSAGPRIIDVLQDGVSATRTRRSEFGGVARRIGLPAALAAEEAAAAALGQNAEN